MDVCVWKNEPTTKTHKYSVAHDYAHGSIETHNVFGTHPLNHSQETHTNHTLFEDTDKDRMLQAHKDKGNVTELQLASRRRGTRETVSSQPRVRG